MRICTFNIRYDNLRDGSNTWLLRRELVAQTIEKIKPDILGLQECMPHQADFLRSKFKEIHFIGAGREDGYKGEMVPLFIRRDRYHLADAGHFWLSKEPHIPGSSSWESSLPRMVTWAVVKAVKSNLLPIWIFNAHFDHHSKQARIESAQLLRSKINALGGQLPVIVMGDLNTGPKSGELDALIGKKSSELLHDIAELKVKGTSHGFTGVPRGPRIDWLLVNKHFEASEVLVDESNENGRYPSDHFPISAKLSQK